MVPISVEIHAILFENVELTKSINLGPKLKNSRTCLRYSWPMTLKALEKSIKIIPMGVLVLIDLLIFS